MTFKKIIVVLPLFILLLSGCSSSSAQNNSTVSSVENNNSVKGVSETGVSETGVSNQIVVYFFWGDGCPHCAKEKPFLEGLEEKYPQLEVKMFEVYYDQDNQELFKEVARSYGVQARGVPATFIGDFDPVVGYGSNQTTGKEIEDMIKQCIEDECVDPGSKL